MPDHLDRIGQQVGDYRLLQWLGGGGFGNVYLAEQMHNHQPIAVKLLQIRLTRSEELKAFINEARTIRLKHPHIVPLLDFGISREDIPFLVMEFADQGTLRDRHPKGTQVPLAEVRSYVQQVASALQYAHEQRIIHRDVKPENMLLRTDGTVMLSDFGIATVAHSSHSLSLHQGIGGTISYMAPEQIKGQARVASDQYGLGVVVYEWIAGRRPFEGIAAEVAMQHMMLVPPSLLAQVPTLSRAVEQVVLKALAKDPSDRFASISDFSSALEKASLERRIQPPAAPSIPASQGHQLPAQEIAPVKTRAIPADGPKQVSSPSPPRITKEEAFSTTLAHLEARRYQESLAALEYLLTLDPAYRYAHNLRGLAFFHLQRYPEALDSLEKAIGDNANDFAAHYGRGLTLARMQRYMEALQAFDRATQIHPGYGTVWRKRGEMLSHLHHYEEGLAAYEQALKIDPNDTDAYAGKATVLKHLGRTR